MTTLALTVTTLCHGGPSMTTWLHTSMAKGFHDYPSIDYIVPQ